VRRELDLPAEPHSARHGTPAAIVRPGLDELPLELADRGEDVDQQPAMGGRCVQGRVVQDLEAGATLGDRLQCV